MLAVGHDRTRRLRERLLDLGLRLIYKPCTFLFRRNGTDETLEFSPGPLPGVVESLALRAKGNSTRSQATLKQNASLLIHGFGKLDFSVNAVGNSAKQL